MVSYATTRALRKIVPGTIMCSVCDRPAVGKGKRGEYLCSFHMRKKYGYLIPVGTVR